MKIGKSISRFYRFAYVAFWFMSTHEFFLDAAELWLGRGDRPVFREVPVGDHLDVLGHDCPRNLRQLYFLHCSLFDYSLCSFRCSGLRFRLLGRLPVRKMNKMIKEEKLQVFQIKGFDFYKLLNGKGRRSWFFRKTAMGSQSARAARGRHLRALRSVKIRECGNRYNFG